MFKYQIANFIGWFFRITYALILIRVMMSWIRPPMDNKIVQFIYQVTETIMYPVRALLNKLNFNMGMLDWTPLFTIILLELLEKLLMSLVI